MSRIILIPYKLGSATCKAIKDALIQAGQRCLRVAVDSRTFRAKPSDKLIYYGGTQQRPERLTSINPDRSIAQNKLTAFRAFEAAGLSTVPWTEEREIANEWITEGKTVVARATLVGHSGAGITIHNTPTDLPTVSLYTKYVKKTYECRIHIYKGRMIDAQIKRKVRDAEENDPLIRNIHTGWVYCREDFVANQVAIDLAIAAVAACNLDFGAVDLIYNKHYNQFYILEVNTAPGLTGTTLTNYINTFIEDLTHA